MSYACRLTEPKGSPAAERCRVLDAAGDVDDCNCPEIGGPLTSAERQALRRQRYRTMREELERLALLWRVIAEAQTEWDMQAQLPDGEPASMSQVGREAYLQQRLLNKLYNIIQIAGLVPGHEWEMRHADHSTDPYA
jgi:hypothetical protein